MKKVPRDGGAGGEATLLVAKASGHLAADDTNVYWNLGDGVSKVPLAGGSPTLLAPGADGDITVNCGSVYWTDADNDVIWRVNANGGEPTALASGPDVSEPVAIAVDDTSVYWTNESSGTVMKLSPK